MKGGKDYENKTKAKAQKKRTINLEELVVKGLIDLAISIISAWIIKHL